MTSKYEHIRQLYLEKISGVLSASDEALLKQMLDGDPECREIWSALSREDESAGVSKALGRIDVESELDKLKQDRNTAGGKSLWLKWIPAAAAAVILLFSVLLFTGRKPKTYVVNAGKAKEKVRLLLGNGTSVDLSSAGIKGTVAVGDVRVHVSKNELESVTGGDAVALNTLIVPAAEDYNITLSDGTRVRLNSESRLRFPAKFTGSGREVYLEGEAFFEVSGDAKHPFIVHTNLASVKVLGTSFNLNAYSKGSVTTSLLSGSVEVGAASGHELRLEPGREAEYSAAAGFTERAFDRDDVLSWMKGVYYFHNTPLAELTPVIRRWFGSEVVFDQEDLADKRITGLLEKNGLNDFLKDLSSTAHLNFYQKGSVLHLSH